MIFLGVSYFGQTIMIWYLTVAIGGFLAETAAEERQRMHARAVAASEAAVARRRAVGSAVGA
jgi:hypothetical protein